MVASLSQLRIVDCGFSIGYISFNLMCAEPKIRSYDHHQDTKNAKKKKWKKKEGSSRSFLSWLPSTLLFGASLLPSAWCP
ncbi:MAG: hypothetical protein DMG05_16680 [Acidobacteria bacterium]|nr:MAG: hypothetical protein DMG05_16680 [Acidobacteriota bacterium]